MKSQINLPILKLIEENGFRPSIPTITKRIDGFLIKWNYVEYHWEIQGKHSKYEVFYKIDDYDFNTAISNLESFIKNFYSGACKQLNIENNLI